MHLFNIDYKKERYITTQNLIHHRGWFANFDLADNPWCWLMGHTPFVYHLPLSHSHPNGVTEYRWVECRICGRRSTKIVPPSPILINDKGIILGTERRSGWQGHKAEFNIETVVRKPISDASVLFHLGSRSSETPIDAHLTVGGSGVYVNTSLCSRLADIITHGHGRDLQLSIHNGSLHWKLWVGEDHPSDTNHMKRIGGKYHAWACRDGSISARPLDYIYGGSPTYSYKSFDGPHTVLLDTNEGTEHHVKLTLQSQILSRPRGPKTMSWVVKWECEEGIPVRNNEWKGDCFYSSAVKVNGIDEWVSYALISLRSDITRDRQRYNWKPSTSEST